MARGCLSSSSSSLSLVAFRGSVCTLDILKKFPSSKRVKNEEEEESCFSCSFLLSRSSLSDHERKRSRRRKCVRGLVLSSSASVFLNVLFLFVFLLPILSLHVFFLPFPPLELFHYGSCSSVHTPRQPQAIEKQRRLLDHIGKQSDSPETSSPSSFHPWLSNLFFHTPTLGEKENEKKRQKEEREEEKGEKKGQQRAPLLSHSSNPSTVLSIDKDEREQDLLSFSSSFFSPDEQVRHTLSLSSPPPSFSLSEDVPARLTQEEEKTVKEEEERLFPRERRLESVPSLESDAPTSASLSTHHEKKKKEEEEEKKKEMSPRSSSFVLDHGLQKIGKSLRRHSSSLYAFDRKTCTRLFFYPGVRRLLLETEEISTSLKDLSQTGKEEEKEQDQKRREKDDFISSFSSFLSSLKRREGGDRKRRRRRGKESNSIDEEEEEAQMREKKKEELLSLYFREKKRREKVSRAKEEICRQEKPSNPYHPVSSSSSSSSSCVSSSFLSQAIVTYVPSGKRDPTWISPMSLEEEELEDRYMQDVYTLIDSWKYSLLHSFSSSSSLLSSQKRKKKEEDVGVESTLQQEMDQVSSGEGDRETRSSSSSPQRPFLYLSRGDKNLFPRYTPSPRGVSWISDLLIFVDPRVSPSKFPSLCEQVKPVEGSILSRLHLSTRLEVAEYLRFLYDNSLLGTHLKDPSPFSPSSPSLYTSSDRREDLPSSSSPPSPASSLSSSLSPEDFRDFYEELLDDLASTQGLLNSQSRDTSSSLHRASQFLHRRYYPHRCFVIRTFATGKFTAEKEWEMERERGPFLLSKEVESIAILHEPIVKSILATYGKILRLPLGYILTPTLFIKPLEEIFSMERRRPSLHEEKRKEGDQEEDKREKRGLLLSTREEKRKEEDKEEGEERIQERDLRLPLHEEKRKDQEVTQAKEQGQEGPRRSEGMKIRRRREGETHDVLRSKKKTKKISERDILHEKQEIEVKEKKERNEEQRKAKEEEEKEDNDKEEEEEEGGLWLIAQKRGNPGRTCLSASSQEILKEYGRLFGLLDEKHEKEVDSLEKKEEEEKKKNRLVLPSIGDVWYGSPHAIARLSRLSFLIVNFLALHDPLFSRFFRSVGEEEEERKLLFSNFFSSSSRAEWRPNCLLSYGLSLASYSLFLNLRRSDGHSNNLLLLLEDRVSLDVSDGVEESPDVLEESLDLSSHITIKHSSPFSPSLSSSRPFFVDFVHDLHERKGPAPKTDDDHVASVGGLSLSSSSSSSSSSLSVHMTPEEEQVEIFFHDLEKVLMEKEKKRGEEEVQKRELFENVFLQCLGSRHPKDFTRCMKLSGLYFYHERLKLLKDPVFFRRRQEDSEERLSPKEEEEGSVNRVHPIILPIMEDVEEEEETSQLDTSLSSSSSFFFSRAPSSDSPTSLAKFLSLHSSSSSLPDLSSPSSSSPLANLSSSSLSSSFSSFLLKECPGNYPFPYSPPVGRRGFFLSRCCSSDRDCYGAPLTPASRCCAKHRFVECRENKESSCFPHRSTWEYLGSTRRYGLDPERGVKLTSLVFRFFSVTPETQKSRDLLREALKHYRLIEDHVNEVFRLI
ncbi:hypothetical protein CSUI_009609 [Cystoisospora suis]|uniref:Transmembrane protein n=1 Tax=Cystoisospora suis TaxID=483139 RepID=A0A2C6KJI6_9APIC|nr:hypothetical protein CSUI_009609 [Cystoisospora suis]